MIRNTLLLFVATLFVIESYAQVLPFKYYYSNTPKVLKSNNDTMAYPFLGGMNAPQFSNIDLNQDGNNDLVIFDRSSDPDGHKLMTFIWKNGKMNYAPEYESLFPELNDWAKMIDYNGDGKADIFTEVTQEDYQLYDTTIIPLSNGLRVFLNTSDGKGLKFKRINDQLQDTGGQWLKYGNVKFGPANIGFSRLDETGIEDIDGDGDIDIVGFDGSSYIIRYYENWTINPQHIPYNHDSIIYIFRDQCWGYVMFDIYSGKNSFKLRQVAGDSMSSCQYQMYYPKQLHAGSSTLLIDLNGDGIKDMVYGDISYPNLISLINDRKHNSLGRDSLISEDTIFPKNTTPANFILQPSAYYVDLNNDKINELLVTTSNTSAVKSANNVWLYSNTGTNSTPVFNYQGNTLPMNMESLDFGTRTAPLLIDIDNDGDQDLIVATNGDYAQTFNYNDRLILYKNISTDSTKPVYSLSDTNFLMLSKDTPILNLHPTFGDLNGDGKPDLIIGDMTGSLSYYTNTSTGSNISFQFKTRNFSGIRVKGFAAPQLIDINKDGKLDLVIGNKQGFIQYFQNTGTNVYPLFDPTPTIDTFGGVFVNKTRDIGGTILVSYTGYATPFVCDLDQDGIYEMFVGSEAGYLYLYKGVNAIPGTVFSQFVMQSVNGVYQFIDIPSSYKSNLINFGARTTPFVGKLDGDSKPDIIMGNLRGGLNAFCSVNTNPNDTSTHPGIGEVTNDLKSKIRVFPNPANSSIQVSLDNVSDDIHYSVYDVVGRNMESGMISKFYSDKEINVQAYSSGIYFITFRNTSGQTYSFKFVVQHE